MGCDNPNGVRNFRAMEVSELLEHLWRSDLKPSEDLYDRRIEYSDIFILYCDTEQQSRYKLKFQEEL